MEKTIIKSALIGGILVFIVSLIFWRVLPIEHHKCFINQPAVAGLVQQNAPAGGVYEANPYNLQTPSSSKDPYIFAIVNYHGKMAPILSQILSLIEHIITAGLIAYLVLKLKNRNFAKIVSFITIIGVILAIGGEFRYVIWAGFPLAYFLWCSANLIVGWYVAALGMARYLK